MTKRTTKTLTISLPPPMVEELDRVRQREHRTRSELVREALRQYVAASERMQRIPVADPEPGELEAAQRGREAIKRGEFVTVDDLLHDVGSRR
jgi:metal-responsive CopG/Arc/MetJ family transcriptional regulator